MRYLLLAATLLAAQDVQLPDLSKGQINGRKAALVWPRFNGKLIQPVDCSVHLVPFSNLDTELVFPCGVWFQPPADTYRIWLEQQDLVSPLHNLLVYSGGPFTGRGLGAVFDVVVGGKVRVASEVQLSPEHHLRLLHLDSHLRLGTFGRSFERRVPATKVHEPVRMPAGRILAVTSDDQGNALTVSRPLVVEERKTLSFVPKPPHDGSDVVVVLARPRVASNEEEGAIDISLDLGGRTVPPDVFVNAADRVYAVWYGVDAREAIVSVNSPTVALPPERLKLRPRTVATLRRTLKLLPSVNVSVHVPNGALQGLEQRLDFVRRSGQSVRQLTIRITEHARSTCPPNPCASSCEP